MQLALECPVQLLEMVQPFADFDFILAQECKKSEYLEFYKASTKIKIVDNGVNEIGEPILIKELTEIYKEVGGNFVISPDWIGDYKKTIEAYQESLKIFGQEQVIGVVQGSTFEEAKKCISWMCGLCNPEKPIRLSLPYDICSPKEANPVVMGMRRYIVSTKIPQNVSIHLLGFNYIGEFELYKELPNVVSVDTGVPIMLGLKGADILENLQTKAQPTLSLMDGSKVTEEGWTAICRNIALLRRYIS